MLIEGAEYPAWGEVSTTSTNQQAGQPMRPRETPSRNPCVELYSQRDVTESDLPPLRTNRKLVFQKNLDLCNRCLEDGYKTGHI